MLSREYAVAAIGIIALFAVGLVLFFLFSAEYGDGLERSLERADVEEGEPIFNAPFSYGEDYAGAFAAGLLGFGTVLALVYGIGIILGRKDATRQH